MTEYNDLFVENIFKLVFGYWKRTDVTIPVTSEMREALDWAMGTLKPLEREVLLLQYRDGKNRFQTALCCFRTRKKIIHATSFALRKLRHPSRSKRLVKALGNWKEPGEEG